ncbi:MAG: hypothetical protein MZW92_42075 [Comamonadaceae bacterium]|nr:hypothetical protein [Comamonadaceae bacterium]
MVLMALKTLELRARRDALRGVLPRLLPRADALPVLADRCSPRLAMLLSVLGPADGAGAGAHAGGPAAAGAGRRGWRRAPRCSARR